MTSDEGLRPKEQTYASTYGSEPLFLFVDERAGGVVPAQELLREELDSHDPNYEVIITVRAVKPDVTVCP